MSQTSSHDGSSRRDEFRVFWSGPRLSVYEELCLVSLVSRKQRVQLFSYEKDLRVPDGVELCDANEIVPGPPREFVYPNGERTLALHSDLFRYEVVRRFGGWYVDLDMILLRDAPPSVDIYLVREPGDLVNPAVMRFPPGSPLLAAAAREAMRVPPNDPWGTVGPFLMTRLVQEHGLADIVRPCSSAFAIDTSLCAMFLPQYREHLEARVADSDFVHLYHEGRRRARILKGYGPPEGSFLDGLFRRFGFSFPAHGRLSPDAVTAWFQEYEVVNHMRDILGVKLLTPGFAAELCETLLHGDRLREERDQIRSERDELLKALDQLHTSTSWRMTALPRAIIHRWRSSRVTDNFATAPSGPRSEAHPKRR
jgi:hypothetical protein